MLQPTVTHYFPWTDSDTFAYCGHAMTAADTHSPAPTCATCAARQAAEEQAWADEALALDADEARAELDPVLNAGAPDLFAFAVALTRNYAAAVRR
jgi:hypothetical protein